MSVSAGGRCWQAVEMKNEKGKTKNENRKAEIENRKKSEVPVLGVEPRCPCGRGIFIPRQLSLPALPLFVVWTVPSP